MMDKNAEITNLANEILLDITNNRLQLHNILLKASNLSLLLNIPANVSLFKEWSKFAEVNEFVIGTFECSIDAAKDPNISLASSNPNQYVSHGFGNGLERLNLRNSAQNVTKTLAYYRAETFNFVQGIYTKWIFGNTTETLFEKKRKRVETVLVQLLPDTHQVLNSISNNLNSTNIEDWKNAVVSCRTLLIDIADKLNPASVPDEKQKYLNRLKDFISPKEGSSTKEKLEKSYLEELKKRIEYTSDITQGKAHQDRPTKREAEDIVLYTYLAVAELLEIYIGRNPEVIKSSETIGIVNTPHN